MADTAYTTRTIHELFLEQAERTPDRIAVSSRFGRLTYLELATASGALADRLSEGGVAPEEIVLTPARRRPQTIVAMLAVLRAGGAYLPLDDRTPSRQIDNLYERLDIRHRIGLHPAAGGGAVGADDFTVSRLGSAGPARRGVADPGNLAYVILTSGSSGEPKAVGVEHANLAHSTAARNEFCASTDVRFLSTQSFAFDASAYEIYWTLTTGSELVIASESDLSELDDLAGLMAGRSVTHLNCAPSLYRTLLNVLPDEALRAVRHVTVGGEACSPDLVRAHRGRIPSAELVNDYGPSECTVWATRYATSDCPYDNGVPIGRPIPRTRVSVMDELAEPLEDGAVGDLHIAGAGVARGYLGSPALTAERFVPDPLGGHGQRMYRTGDLVRRAANGELEFVGRADEEVKIRGYRINLQGLTRLLLERDDIADAAVVKVGEGLGAHLMAFVVAVPAEAGDDEGLKPDATALRRYLLTRVPPYVVPQRYAFVSELPRTPRGKIDREMLRSMNSHDEKEPPPAVEPLDAGTVDHVATAVAAVLELGDIQPDADLFEYGLTSLHIAQLVGEFSRSFGVRMRSARIFEEPTIQGVAKAIDEYLAEAENENRDVSAFLSEEIGLLEV